MTALASAFVEAKLDTSGFGSDIKRGLTHSSVRSSVESAGKDSGKHFTSGFGSAMKGIAGVASAAFAGVQVVSFFKDSIAQAQESAKVAALTAQVIKTTGGAAGVTAKQVGALSTAISNKTGIDDEAIQSGSNLLLTFKNIHDEAGKGNKIFDRATQSVTDMSVALGQPMKAGAIQLGKALNDPIKGVTALSRVGVTFDDQQKKQIKRFVESGNTMKAQKIILKELNSEFGGAAAAAATPAEKASVAWGNFKESVGGLLLPVLGKLATWFTETALPAVEKFGAYLKSNVIPAIKTFIASVVSSVADLKAKFADQITAVIDTVKSSFQGFVNVGKTIFDFLKNNKDVVAAFAITVGVLAAGIGLVTLATTLWTAALALNPIGLVVIALAALVAGFVYAYKSSDTFRAIVDKAWSSLKTGAADFWNSVKPVLEELVAAFKTVVDYVIQQWPEIQATIMPVMKAIGTIIKGALTIIEGIFHTVMGLITGNWGEAWKGLQQILKGEWTLIKGVVKLGIAYVKDILKAGWNLIKLGAKLAWDGIKKSLQLAWDAVKALIGKGVDALKTLLGKAWDWIKTTAAKAFSPINDAIKSVIQFFKNLAGAGLDMAGNMVGAFKWLLSGILTVFGKIVDGAAAAFGWMPGIGGKVKDAQAAFHAMATGAVGSLNTIEGNLHTMADTVRGLPKPKFDAGDATRDVKNYAWTVAQSLKGIPDETVQVVLSAQASKVANQLGRGGSAFNGATGGPVRGPGTATSDSIPALLSNNEHVWTAEEVHNAGGHRMVEGLRHLAKRKLLGKVGDLGLPGFADGGMVTPRESSKGLASSVGSVGSGFAAVVSGISAALSKKANDYYTHLVTGTIAGLGTNGHLSPAQQVRGQNFAKSQDGKPYQWGGIGNPSWDCSGFVGGVLLAALGQNPHRRLGTTASMPWSGFSRGTGSFTVANDPGSHMDGAIGGMGIESNGYWGVNAGPLHTPLSSFAQLWKYDRGGMLAHGGVGVNRSGRPEAVLNPEQTKAFKTLATSVAKFAGGGPVAGLDAGQTRIAQIIIDVGQQMHMTNRDQRIALMTGLTESTLHNYAGGDGSSSGVFQQTVGNGWGTAAQRRDPAAASRMFYAALRKVRGHESMGMGQAAQAVQNSAYPGRYATHGGEALKIFQALKGRGGGPGGPGGGGGSGGGGGGGGGESPAERRKAARQDRRGLRKEEKNFLDDATGDQTRSETKASVKALIDAFKKVVGDNSPLLKHLGKLGDRIVALQKVQDKANKQWDRAAAKLSALKGRATEYANTVGAAYTHDPFGGSLDDFNLQLRADTHDDRHIKDDFKKLKHRGLSGPLLKALQASGNVALIDQFAHLSRAQIAHEEKLFHERHLAELHLGKTAADSVYGKAIREQTRETHHLHRVVLRLDRRLEHLDRKLERAVEKGARDGTHHGHRDHDHHTRVHRRSRR